MKTIPEPPATVLLVDDEPEILIALTDLLEGEFRVLSARSGVEALRLLAAEPGVAVIISDQRMPEMTGDVLLAKAHEVCQAESLLLTGYADLEAVIAALNHGRIGGYAPKPWEPSALLAMVRSAAERFRLSRALETERVLLRGMMDSSADPVSFRDMDGRLVRMNRVKAAALGQAEEWLGRIIPFDEEERRALASERGTEVVEQRSGQAGLPHWFRIARLPVRDASGTVTHLATVEHDITEQRLLEERLHQAEKMQALGTLAGGVAHDFNNLLTAILGSLELLAASGLSNPRQLRMVSNAVSAAERGSALTKRLLSFSRKRELQPRPSNVNRLVMEMEDLLLRSLGDQMQLQLEFEATPWCAMVDPEQLGLALLNLCINSRDAMPDGGCITLATRNVTVTQGEMAELAAGDYVAVSVRDTGTGMSPAVLAQAFEPFFTTKEVGRGTGLGLSMVYGLTRQSGGTTTIVSTEGVGTTVEMFLPRAGVPEAMALDPSPVRRAGVDPARILVVDDDPAVRGVTVTFLNDLGHTGLEAESGSLALDLLRSTPVDMVVTDLMMPGMTGRDLATQIGLLYPRLPILMLSGYAEAEQGASYPILRKPFRKAELAEQVALLLAHKAGPT